MTNLSACRISKIVFHRTGIYVRWKKIYMCHKINNKIEKKYLYTYMYKYIESWDGTPSSLPFKFQNQPFGSANATQTIHQHNNIVSRYSANTNAP